MSYRACFRIWWSFFPLLRSEMPFDRWVSDGGSGPFLLDLCNVKNQCTSLLLPLFGNHMKVKFLADKHTPYSWRNLVRVYFWFLVKTLSLFQSFVRSHSKAIQDCFTNFTTFTTFTNNNLFKKNVWFTLSRSLKNYYVRFILKCSYYNINNIIFKLHCIFYHIKKKLFLSIHATI